MKAIVTIGVSASGKSTWAREFMAEQAKTGATTLVTWVQLERDNIRRRIQLDAGIDCGESGVNWAKWKWKNEKLVTEKFWESVAKASVMGMNLIISDTNLNSDRLKAMVDRLREYGYTVETKEFPVSFEEACKRDAKRENGVGVSVLARQFEQWNATHVRQYEPNPFLFKAVIVDVDGTLAKMDGRGPFDWDRVGEDKPNQFVINTVNALANAGYEIIVMSGRDGVCVDETRKWLVEHGVHFNAHFQRAAGDQRPDTVIKEELFWRHVAKQYNVEFVIDDRPVMVRQWRAMGLETMAVGNQHIDF